MRKRACDLHDSIAKLSDPSMQGMCYFIKISVAARSKHFLLFQVRRNSKLYRNDSKKSQYIIPNMMVLNMIPGNMRTVNIIVANMLFSNIDLRSENLEIDQDKLLVGEVHPWLKV